jgi:DNA polymerase-3 subunit delta
MAKQALDEINRLRSALKKKEFAPVYLFHGDEDFLITETVDLLVQQALDEAGKSFNFDVIYGGDADPKSIAATAAMFPMMSERRVVIVKEFDKLSDKEQLLPYISNPSPTTCLVLIASEADLRLKIYKTLKEHADVVEFPQFKEYQIPNWIEERIIQRGKRITPEAVQIFHAQTDRSLRELQNEIDKLFIYIGDKPVIDADDVSNIVGISKEFNNFGLQKAVGEKNLEKALSIMDQMMERGEVPAPTIATLTGFFQKLWMVQEMMQKGVSPKEMAAALDMKHPSATYFITEYTEAARKFSSAEVENAFLTLNETDTKLKSSQEDKNLLMTLMLYRIVRPGAAKRELAR